MAAPTFSYLTDVYFSPGAAGQVPAICERLGISHPLLVTDPGIMALGLTERLELPSVSVFAGVHANPTVENVEAGVEVWQERECDGVIGLGGGSPIDCAKAIALRATHSGPLESYALVQGGTQRITADRPPVVAVPTTAGTGSEVGRAALIGFGPARKLGIIGRQMIPDAAVCDPALTLGLPPLLTAATGIDALSHCVETYCSPRFNPVADAIALDGLRRGWLSLPHVMERPDDIEARGAMMMASTQGALAFQKGLGLVHSLSHPLGALPGRHLHHGTLNSIFLPHVIRFNGATCAEKFARMASVMGVPPESDAIATAFHSLHTSMGLPGRLRDLGVTREDLTDIPRAALRDHSTPTNPREVTEADCRDLLLQAL